MLAISYYSVITLAIKAYSKLVRKIFDKSFWKKSMKIFKLGFVLSKM